MEMMEVKDLRDLIEIEAFIRKRGFDFRGWAIDCTISALSEEVITLKFVRDYSMPLSNGVRIFEEGDDPSSGVSR